MVLVRPRAADKSSSRSGAFARQSLARDAGLKREDRSEDQFAPRTKRLRTPEIPVHRVEIQSPGSQLGLGAAFWQQETVRSPKRRQYRPRRTHERIDSHGAYGSTTREATISASKGGYRLSHE
jgi:hypothetical protein